MPVVIDLWLFRSDGDDLGDHLRTISVDSRDRKMTVVICDYDHVRSGEAGVSWFL
jgi:hypothetical protein